MNRPNVGKIKTFFEMRPRYALVILAILLLCGWFYWSQWRPTQIKMECSWVTKHTAPIQKLTQEEIDMQKERYNSCVKQYPNKTPPRAGIILYDYGHPVTTSSECLNMPTGYDEVPREAQPSWAYLDPATPAEYAFCIHSRGL